MILIIVFLLILVCNSLFDFWLINDLVWIDHAKSTFIWLMVYIIFGGLVYYTGCVERPLFLRVCVLWPSVRWLVHDLVLNGLRGLKWDYLGKGEKAALTDRLLARLSFHFIWLKVFIFLVSLMVFLI